MVNFRDLREFAIRRAGQEHAHSRRPEEVGHAAIQLRDERRVSDGNIVQAIETMTNKEVGTLQEMGRQVLPSPGDQYRLPRPPAAQQ